MESHSLQNLTEQIAGKEDVSLIVSALMSLEVQTEISLTETSATQAIHRAVDYIRSDMALFSPQQNALTQRRQLITEHLRGL